MTNDRKLRVLWATDGSSNALNALPLLRQVVLPAAGKLTVLTVAPLTVMHAARPDPDFLKRAPRAVKQRALVEARHAAEHDATALDPPIPVEALPRWGHPVEEIIKASAQADLIVMAAKGHSNLRVAVLGSVTQGVAQHSPKPILVARPGSRTVRKIIVSYHGSAASRKALSFLDRLHLPDDAELHLFTALEPLTMPEDTPAAFKRRALAEAHEIAEKRHRDAEKELEGIAAKLSAAGRRVRYEVGAGFAAGLLDQEARRHNADLMVVGSRRPSPGGQYLLGATAEKLLRHAHTSVLVVR